jgi:Flp pilus assembly protein TadB
MLEILSIVGLLSAVYLFINIYRFPKKQLQQRIFAHIDYPARSAKNINIDSINLIFLRRNIKKFSKTQIPAQEIAEFADLLALALIAGRNPSQALEEIQDLLSLRLENAIKIVLLKNASGMGFENAMAAMAETEANEALFVMVRSLQFAIERGTPLAEILRNFSHDLRSRTKENILRSASKKEISMLVPIVFVVLPTVLLIAIYPALQVIKNLS